MAKKFEFNRDYIVDKPEHKRSVGYDKWWFFYVKERDGHNITFRKRERFNLTDYKSKVLVNPVTGEEICFITIDNCRCMLDTNKFISSPQRVTEETLNSTVEGEWNEEKQEFVATDDCGVTLNEFLKKKGEEKSKE